MRAAKLEAALRLVLDCAGDIQAATNADLEAALSCGDPYTEKQANAWLVARDALAQQVAVPDGWVLVPIEPTDAMCEAAWEGEGVDYVGEHKRIHRADLAYIRMLAAAQGAKLVTKPDSQPEHKPDWSAA